MRLQLTVFRQELPPVQILWATQGFWPTDAACGDQITICQLLEQINDVIPLEAENWGLEDYAVEVGGFECLHFCALGQVLKEDDKVTIRPLQTKDLRARRRSGRCQISADGKHLVDGVAFGRPFLKRATRPPLSIPPRKRIKLVEDDAEEYSDIEDPFQGNQEFVVRSGSYKPNVETLDLNEDDEEYQCDGQDDEDITGELADLAKDSQELDESYEPPVAEVAKEVAERLTRSRKRRRESGLGLQGDGILNQMDSDGGLYSGVYHNPLLDQYYQDEPSQSWSKESEEQLSRICQPKRTVDTVTRIKSSGQQRKRSSSASMKSVRFEDRELGTPATIIGAENNEGSEKENFQPADLIKTDLIEANKENIEPALDDESTTESSILDSSLDSSSDTDSITSNTSSSFTSSSGSSSGSSTEVSEDVSPETYKIERGKATLLNEMEGTPPNSEVKQRKVVYTLPGQGLRRTQKRNVRRRIRRKITYLKSIGVLSSGATPTDFKKWEEAREESKRNYSVQVNHKDETGKTDLASAFEAKKQALLDAISAGGIDFDEVITYEDNGPINIGNGHSTKVEIGDRVMRPSETGSNETPAQSSALFPQHNTEIAETPNASRFKLMEEPPPGEIPSRRAKLDLASSRRMLFGSLGLRTPKTKEEEDKLREKLSEDFRSIPHIPNREGYLESEILPDNLNEVDQDWRDKIDLKAVECCYEGVKLSIPPFPFVQRWDPQQRGELHSFHDGQGSSRGKRRKRNKKPSYLGESTEDYRYDLPDQHPEPKALSTNTKVTQEGSDEYQHAVDEQLMRDANVQSEKLSARPEDLPELLEDMATYATLVKEVATPGTIIAFKQLDMSQETNWQPKVSEYRTAVINEIPGDGRLSLTLAYRDRVRNKKNYDEETGERLYSKFEMPDYEDEADEEDTGICEVIIAELIDPKVVKAVEVQFHKRQPPESSQLEIETVDMSALIDVDGEMDEGDSNMNEDIAIAEFQETIGVASDSQADDTKTISMLNKEIGATLSKRVPRRLNEPEVSEVNEESRQDISLLIKEAGFRSRIDPDVDRGLKNYHDPKPTLRREEEPTQGKTGGNSPKFAGFSSSPPSDEYSRQGPHITDAAVQTSSPLIGKNISEPLTNEFWLSREASVEDLVLSPKKDHWVMTEVDDHEGDDGFLPPPSDLSYDERIRDSTGGERTSSPRQRSQIIGLSVRVTDNSKNYEDLIGPFSKPSHDTLLRKESGDEINSPSLEKDCQTRHTSTSNQDEDKQGADSLPSASDQLNGDTINRELEGNKFPSLPRKTSTTKRRSISRAQEEISKKIASFWALDRADSDDDFPTVRSVLSATRPLLDQCVKKSIKDAGVESKISPPRHNRKNIAKSKVTNNSESQSQPSLPTFSITDDLGSSSTPPSDDERKAFLQSSQIPVGSQIVDLTLSSDPVDRESSEYESDAKAKALPSGPGWVKKRAGLTKVKGRNRRPRSTM